MLRRCRPMLVALAILPLASCASETHVFEIRARDPECLADDAGKQAAYHEEFEYLRSRRAQLLGARRDIESTQPNSFPPSIIGLAMSGGGIRSATFNLGVLQAANHADLLDQIDYISAVSGGAYIAAWQQAHIGAANALPRDRFAYEVGARTEGDLLRNHNEHVEHLRTHSGFLNQGRSWFEGMRMAEDYLWRWPFHLVLDDLIHLRGKVNFQHIIDIYRSRIEGTYFRGDPPPTRGIRSISEFRLIEANEPGIDELPPYMILNANLTNQGRSRVNANGKESRPQWNFEFTRDFTGSDATGYIESDGFDLPVRRVVEKGGLPVAAEVELDGTDASPFRLSAAVATSGAAFDSLFVGNWIRWWGVSEAVHLIGGGLLNLYLGLDAPNFSRALDDGWEAVADYARMVTYQRIPRLVDPGARWLYITDGGHYENLGVLALLRRGTRCIVSIDATADQDRRFGDLRRLRKRVEDDLGLKWVSALPSEAALPTERFVVETRSGATQAVILYIKASADPEFPHMREEAERQEAARRARSLKRILEDLRYQSKLLSDEMVQGMNSPDPGYRSARQALDRILDTEITFPKQQLEEVANSVQKEEKLSADLAKATREVDSESRKLKDSSPSLGMDGASLQPPPESPEDRPMGGPRPAPAVGSIAVPSSEDTAVAPPESNPQLDAARENSQALRMELASTRLELERLRRDSTLVDQFDRTIRNPSKGAIANMQRALGATADDWTGRFELILARARQRLERLGDEEVNRDKYREARRARIERINAFSANSWTFPNDSTLNQSYEWERFEAYRVLGYQMADAYLDLLEPDPTDKNLEWCRFADVAAP